MNLMLDSAKTWHVLSDIEGTTIFKHHSELDYQRENRINKNQAGLSTLTNRDNHSMEITDKRIYFYSH